MIETKNLTKRYGRLLAVDRLNLFVPKGSIFGFIGPNGAGKTTTIKMLAGLIEPDSGTVLIRDTDIRQKPENAKQQIGFIPDRPYLYEKLTGLEFLKFTADLYGVVESAFHKKAERILDKFSLIDWKNELIEAYSHGMKQRLIMAAAILHDPKIIIVDEPMIGLDPAGIKMVKHMFRELADSGVTFFISTHTLSIAQDLCDRIGIIQKGKLIATGTLDDLKTQAQATSGDLEAVFLKLTREESLLQGYQDVPGISP
ncbi:MAG: ABC transporter ATP-binding protein [Desulfobacteraceae bacterium]|nr:ABC transporter ATP-binding protein [Desulfobacteraceae bacterium]MBC2755598.1 ABC transporter ATP-binding protein [Desulfobacteraceae bacterium]